MAADNSTRSFTVRPADHHNVRGRATRRIFISDDTMKLAKWLAGDVVVLLLAAPSQLQVGVPLLKASSAKSCVTSRDPSQWGLYGRHQSYPMMVSISIHYVLGRLIPRSCRARDHPLAHRPHF